MTCNKNGVPFDPQPPMGHRRAPRLYGTRGFGTGGSPVSDIDEVTCLTALPPTRRTTAPSSRGFARKCANFAGLSNLSIVVNSVRINI